MKKSKLPGLILIMIFLLTSCEIVDPKIMNETHRPELNTAPINGTWILKKVIYSDSRYSLEEGEEFHFNIEFFATNDKIYLNPDFEIINIESDRYLREIIGTADPLEIEINEKINVVEIKKDGLVIAEATFLNRDQLLLHINNKLIILERESDFLSSEEKNEIKTYYLEREKVFKSGDSWGLALGVRSQLEKDDYPVPAYEYSTILMRFSDKGLIIDNLDGIIVNNDSLLDVYSIIRVKEKDRVFDKIILNNKELKIIDYDKLGQSDTFRLNYLSNRYATLEYLYPEKDKLNTLSTYTTLTGGGLNQLRIGDIVNYSTERVMDAITKANSETTFGEAVYNIGLTRDSGLTVLKGRVVSRIEEERFNSDYILSSNFGYINERNQRRVNYQEIRSAFPEVVDVYATPIDNQYIIITKEAIELAKLDRQNRYFRIVYSRKFEPNATIVSSSWFSQGELELMEKSLLDLRSK